MPSNASVGKITLDLQVLSDITGQVKGIADSVGQSFQKSLFGVMDSGFKNLDKSSKKSIGAIMRPMEKAAESTKNILSNAVQEQKTAIDTVDKQLDALIQKALNKPLSPVGNGGPLSGPVMIKKPKLVEIDFDAQKSSNVIKSLDRLTDEYKEKLGSLSEVKIDKELIKGEKKLRALKERLAEYQELGRRPTSKTFIDTEKRIELLKQKLSELNQLKMGFAAEKPKQDLQDLAALLEKFSTRLGSLSADTIEAEFVRLERRLQALLDKQQKFVDLGQDFGSEGYRSLQYDIQQTSKDMEDLERVHERVVKKSSVFSKINLTLARSFQTLSGAIRTAGNGFKSVLKQLVQGVGRTTRLNGAFRSLGNQSKGLGKSILSLGNMFKMLLIRMAMRGVVNGARDGLQNLAQYSEATNKSLSALKSSLTQLKNSFATAFAPILNIVVPILTKLNSLLSQVATTIGMFFAALTGQKSFTKAVSVVEDYASGISGATKAAKEHQKQLMGFDEINKLSAPADSSGGGSGGGADIGDMFETVSIDSKIQGFVDRIKDLFKQGDFSGIGEIIGNKINSGLQKVNDFIHWDNLGKKITAAVHGFADFFNSLVRTIDWHLMGDTLAQGFNTVVNTLYEFLTSIDWLLLGTAFATGLNGIIHGVDWGKLGQTLGARFMATIDFLYGAIQTFDFKGLGSGIASSVNNVVSSIDWKKTGKMISDGFRGLLEFIKTTIAEIDWYQIGKAISDFVLSIDWGGIIRDLAYIRGQAIAGLGLLIWGAIEDCVKAIGSFFAQAFEDAGGDIIGGLLLGIGRAIVGIGAWLWNNLVAPIIDGVKSMFGIHSPSTVFAEIGKFLIEGLVAGIKGLFNSAVDIFRNLWGAIQNVFKSTINFFSNIFSNAWGAVKSAFSSSAAGSFFSGVWGNIKNSFGNIAGWFKEKFSAAWTAVKNVFSTGGKIFDGIKDGILNGLKAVINGLISGINKVISIPFNGLNSALRSIKNISIMGITPFSFLPTIGVPQIPRLATGGIIDTPTLAMVGEAGKEAVMPLENNTGWINDLAGQLANKMGTGGGISRSELETIVMSAAQMIVAALSSIGIYMDEEKVARIVTRTQTTTQGRYAPVMG